MTLNELLKELAERKVKLWAEGDRLHLRAPKGALTPKLHEILSKNKSKILILLSSKAGFEENTLSKAYMEKEAVLDRNIFPKNLSLTHAASSDAKNILLTGATGFLGAFLLDELLQQTKADIYCLVRSSGEKEGKNRIQNVLKSYSLWKKDSSERIVPIPGDLSLSRFGLSSIQFNDLSHRIEKIYHCGAIVNLFYPYTSLRAANVNGTKEVFRFACRFSVKPVHYISSIIIFDSSGYKEQEMIPEDAEPDHGEKLRIGYAQSKWVAEKIAASASERGLPVCIYRTGVISGHSQTGVYKTDDLSCRLLKEFIQAGCAPKQDLIFDLTPVDFVSRAVVHLSNQTDSIGRTFHIVNPEPIPWNELFRMIHSLGYPIELIEYSQWKESANNRLCQASREETSKPLLINLFSSEMNPNKRISQLYDCRNTLTGLKGTSIICPKINKALLETYFSYLIRIGFLPPPDKKAG